MSKALFRPDTLKSMLSHLKTSELEDFLKIVSSILDNRKQRNNEEKELDLLKKINNCTLPNGNLERFLFLREKRQKKELPKQELAELFSLIEEEQKLQVKRIKLLKKLADLKNITVPVLMKQLEITAPASV